jgi:hypothetical protein
LADGRRMRGADTRTGSGTRRRRRVCGCAAWGGTSARAAARAGAVRDRGGVGRGLRVRWNGGCGRAPMAAAGKGGSAAAWAEGCGWIGCEWGLGCVWLVGGVVRVLAAGRGLWVGDSACVRARRRAAAVGSWRLLCAAGTRPLSDFLFYWATSRGRACLVTGRGDARRDAPWQLLRTRGCGWGCAGRAVLADGWRMRRADTRTGSGGGRRRRVCGCAAWVARVRGLRLARGLCEIGVVWVEVCGFVGAAAVVGRRWRRRERAGRRPLGRSAAVGSAAVCGLGVCGWLVVWCVCWRWDAGFGRRLGVRCGRAGVRRPLDRGLWCVQRVRGPSPTSSFAGRSLGGGPVF